MSSFYAMGTSLPGLAPGGRQKPIKEPEKIEDYMFEVIDQSLNWNNERASYQKNDFSPASHFGFGFF